MSTWLVSNAVAAAVLAVVVTVWIRLVRPNPAVRHALWLLVLVKLLSPAGFVWEVPLPFGFELPAVAPAARPPTATRPAAVEPDVQLVAVWFEGGPAGGEPRRTDAVDVPPAAVEGPAAPASPTPVGFWLVVAWAAGAGLAFLRHVARAARFARVVRRAAPAGAALVAEVAALAAKLGVRPPPVRCLAGLPTPVVWCLGRPVLLWPAGLERALKPAGRRAVLLHELAHLRRRDHRTRWVELVAGAVHWWNPVYWLARRKARDAAELACDAWVTGTVPADRRAYAEALIEVCAGQPVRPAALRGSGRRRRRPRHATEVDDDHARHGAVPAAEVGPAAAGRPADGRPAGLDPGPGRQAGRRPTRPADPDRTRRRRRREGRRRDRPGPEMAGRPGGRREERHPEDRGRDRATSACNWSGSNCARRTAAATALLDEAKKRAEVERQTAEEAVRKATEEFKRRAALDGVLLRGVDGSARPKVKVFDAKTGKELTDVRIEFVGGEKPKAADEATAALVRALTAAGAAKGGAEAPAMTRTTYKLSKDKAELLGGFLKQCQAKGLKAMIEGESVTVTAPPDVQNTVAGLVGLLTGKPAAKFEFFFDAKPAAAPAPAATPAKFKYRVAGPHEPAAEKPRRPRRRSPEQGVPFPVPCGGGRRRRFATRNGGR